MEALAKKETPEQAAMRKANLLMAASQLDMLTQAFGEAPERVKKAAEEFKASLEEWATQ